MPCLESSKANRKINQLSSVAVIPPLRHKHSHVISWQPNNRAGVIHQPSNHSLTAPRQPIPHATVSHLPHHYISALPRHSVTTNPAPPLYTFPASLHQGSQPLPIFQLGTSTQAASFVAANPTGYYDNGASYHLVNALSLMYDTPRIQSAMHVDGVGGRIQLTHQGRLSALPALNNMNRAYYSKDLPTNLISLGYLQRSGATYGTDPTRPHTHTSQSGSVSPALFLLPYPFPATTCSPSTSPRSRNLHALANDSRQPAMRFMLLSVRTTPPNNCVAQMKQNNYITIVVIHPTTHSAPISLTAKYLGAH